VWLASIAVGDWLTDDARKQEITGRTSVGLSLVRRKLDKSQSFKSQTRVEQPGLNAGKRALTAPKQQMLAGGRKCAKSQTKFCETDEIVYTFMSQVDKKWQNIV
jgi:hypothetical protein